MCYFISSMKKIMQKTKIVLITAIALLLGGVFVYFFTLIQERSETNEIEGGRTVAPAQSIPLPPSPPGPTPQNPSNDLDVSVSEITSSCSSDVKVCPEGYVVSRSVSLACDFEPCKTVEWKKYVDDMYGFSFSYPVYSAEEPSHGQNDVSQYYVVGGIGNGVWINVIRDSKTSPKEDKSEFSALFYLRKFQRDPLGFQEINSKRECGVEEADCGPPSYTSVSKMKVDGVPAIKYVEAGVGGVDTAVIFEKDEIIYEIRKGSACFPDSGRRNGIECYEFNKLVESFRVR